MEIPEISIRQINIPQVYIPEIYKPDPVLPVITNLDINVAGCTYQHRDIKNTGNTQLLLDDPNGVFTTCDSVFPSFYPIDYRPDQIVITEDLPITNNAPPMPESDVPEVKNTEEKKEIKIEPCPAKDAPFMAGDYRNDKKIQRLVKWERNLDGVSCDPIWENVPFRESFIGTPETLVSTAVIGLVAGGSAVLVPLIQGAAKAGIKKLGKRFAKKDEST